MLPSFNYGKVIPFFISRGLHVSMCPLATMMVQKLVGAAKQRHTPVSGGLGVSPNGPQPVIPSQWHRASRAMSELNAQTASPYAATSTETLPESRDWRAVDQTANNNRKGMTPPTSTNGTQPTRACDPPIDWEMTRAMTMTAGIIWEATPMRLPSDSFTRVPERIGPRRPDTP